jgi:hypothetical protein
MPENAKAKNSTYISACARACFPGNGAIPFKNTAGGKSISPFVSRAGVPRNKFLGSPLQNA